MIKQKVKGMEQIKPDHQSVRVGDIAHSLADISAAQKGLGYQSIYPVKQGIEATVDYFIQ